jgi:hypothetical protein
VKSDGLAARFAGGRSKLERNSPGEAPLARFKRECARPGKGTVVAQLGVPNETALRKSNGESHLRRAVSGERRGQDSVKARLLLFHSCSKLANGNEFRRCSDARPF